ncbi:MAG: hypothetical protein ACR2M1_08610 [Gemmatimonadaceae bacterium]
MTERLRPWRDRGPVGLNAAQYMEARVRNEELVARSFYLYAGVLDGFTQFAKIDLEGSVRWLTMLEAFSDAHVAHFLSSLQANPFQQRLARQVLRHFAKRRGQDRPQCLLVALEHVRCDGAPVMRGAPCTEADDEGLSSDEANAASSPGSRIPDRAEITKIDEEVAHILRFAASARGAHTADHYTVMRAAAVAFCRFGGAVVADLVSMKLADVLTSGLADVDQRRPEAVGDVWLALRPRRRAGLTGVEKFATLRIQYEPQARAPIVAWVAERLRNGAGEHDSLFVDPATGESLTRQFIWRLVAGHALKEQQRMDDRIHTPRAERPPVKDDDSPPLLSPSRLRHAQGIGLVERFGFGEVLNTALRNHMGVSQRGLASSYRRGVLALPSNEITDLGSAAEP